MLHHKPSVRDCRSASASPVRTPCTLWYIPCVRWL
uniref:Uncharacterized protein n=1 Tax=Anguilla anguilla TaxID=7936 RepID=A0A0E9WFC6_ANGAN